MWQNVKELVDETIVLTLDEVRAAIKNLLEKNHVLAEGAGAAPLAAALKYHKGVQSEKGNGKKLVAVISGGNINPSTLTSIITK